MVIVTISYPELSGHPHRFATAMEACRFLTAIPSLPDDARIAIKVQPTTRYRVVCHTTNGQARWLRIMANRSIRTCRDQADSSILPSREEAYRYCDQANKLATVDYAAPEVV